MSNMSYCRFENTLSDLSDCEVNMDEKLSEREERARKKLIELCTRIINNYGKEIK